jgi:hypothetical protein
MPAHPSRQLLLACLAALALLAAGCGKKGHVAVGQGPAHSVVSAVGQGAVSIITSNTSRVGGIDVAVDAAAVARTVYPGLTVSSRPTGAVLVNERDWPGALAASALSASPLRAPLLYSEGNRLPSATRQALIAMHPTGEKAFGGAKVLRIGSTALAPDFQTTRSLPFVGAALTAAAIERLVQAAEGGSKPKQVIVVALNAPRSLQMPAAGLAAQSGAPILFSTSAGLPEATSAILRDLGHPSIYVLNPLFVGKTSLGELARLGRVTQIAGGPGGEPASRNAIAVARFTDGSFGWGIKEPGHGLVFENLSRPLDAPAAAVLSASGDYAPPLLLERPNAIPPSLSTYLGDIQPAYTAAPQFRAVRGVYNHGWLIGDVKTISPVIQGELNSLLEIAPSKQTAGEETSSELSEGPEVSETPPSPTG